MEEQMNAGVDLVERMTEMAWNFLVEKTPAILGAIVVLFIGLRIIRGIVSILNRYMERAGVSDTLRPFLRNLSRWTLQIMLYLSIARMVGIETTSFIAILGAAGLAVGLALQGTLQSFAGGVMILLFKPFKVGDVIDGAGYMGTIDEIQLFVTKMRTFQNRLVIIPNSKLSNDSITNYSALETARVDLTVGVSYDADLQKTKAVLENIVSSDTRILKDPAPLVAVAELADSSVNFFVRPWVKAPDYWDVYFDVTERMKVELEAAGISIPFPQMDVHLQKEG